MEDAMRCLMLALLLTGCASSVTEIHRDDQGRITQIEQPRHSRVEIPGEIVVETREERSTSFLEQILTLGLIEKVRD